MNTNIIISAIFIFMGIIIMLISIIRMMSFKKVMAFVIKSHQNSIKRYIILRHLLMMLLFLSCFIALIISVFYKRPINEAFVSMIFFFGTLYVLSVTILQSRILSEMQETIQVILPICFKCKKIRISNGDHSDPKVWKAIDSYITERANIKFTHGLCPDCFEEEKKLIEKQNNN
ncbi:hypothetical protein JW824_07380 [bacterium]|nr:hypothetical protein [bacterium]RQV95140.1 MAG: hypothetical protein EH221_06745 [bacterium]